jgi:hypothetical protein
MGGAPLPVVVEWRGIYTDPITADLLDDLAASVGPYVRPIPGCGSRQGARVQVVDRVTGKRLRTVQLGSTAKSADTHVLDGVVDLDAEQLTDAEARELETRARERGAAAWFRPRTSPYTGNDYGWQRHVHLARVDAELADAARRQVAAYRNRLDGLAVPHADRGSHAYLTRTWPQYLAQKDDTMTPQQLQQLVDEIRKVPARTWDAVLIGHDEDGAGPEKAPAAPARSWLVMGRRDAGRSYWNTDTVEAQLAALRLQLAGTGDVDAGELAQQLAQLLAPGLRDALVAELPQLDVDAGPIADAVLARLGAKLAPVDDAA